MSDLPVTSMSCLSPCDATLAYLTSGEVADLVLMAGFFVLFVALHSWIALRYTTLRSSNDHALAQHKLLAAKNADGLDEKLNAEYRKNVTRRPDDQMRSSFALGLAA